MYGPGQVLDIPQRVALGMAAPCSAGGKVYIHRRSGARRFTDMVDALAEIRDLCSPRKSWNRFKATGYVLSQSPVL